MTDFRPVDRRRPPPHARQGRRALTLIEVLIALTITTVACGVLASLMSATAQGTNNQNDGRRALVRMQSIKATLQDELYNARAILATGSSYVVFWTGDQYGAATVPNNAVNYTEMRLLEVDASGNLKLHYISTTGLTNAQILTYDQTLAASADFYSTFVALKSTNYCKSITLATGVTSFSAALDNATVTAARMLHLRIDFSDGTVTRQIAFGAAMARPQAPY